VNNPPAGCCYPNYVSPKPAGAADGVVVPKPDGCWVPKAPAGWLVFVKSDG